MNNNKKEKNERIFTESDQLMLHQLRLMEWLDSNIEAQAKGKAVVDTETKAISLPEKWQLTKGIQLYPWQEQCIDKWFDAGGRGTVKVVTGGGKTLLALAIAERLQNTTEKNLRVAIVVPTIVLMHQWYDEIIERGNIPPDFIGRLGGGYNEDFSKKRRILIGVLASAKKKLPKVVEKANVGASLLLVADECHHMGATEASQIFETKRSYNLGLSATPEREDDEDPAADASYATSLLGRELGPIIYNFNLVDALKLGVIPPFTIYHYGLPLSSKERAKYDRLSRVISEAQSELKNRAPSNASSGASFFQWARRVSSSTRSSCSGLALRYVSDIARRKKVLYQMDARVDAVIELLTKEFNNNPEARVILFHESIEEVMSLFRVLKDKEFAAIAEHSKLPASIRETGLQLFRKGTAKIIVSARSLIEGFNVPAVDMAIIVASSASVRQRVQSLGRVLRKHRGTGGEEKTSCIHVLYGHETVDDMIYGKHDWDRTTGVDRNIYYLWKPGEQPVEQKGPPRSPLPTELEVNAGSLQPGCLYPGEYAGEEFHCDTRGNIQNSHDEYVVNPGKLCEAIISVKGSAGRFRITPQKKYVLVRIPEGDEWITRFVDQLTEDFSFERPQQNETGFDKADIEAWLVSASPGDPYPFASISIVDDKITFKGKRGGVLSKRVPGGEVFARVGEKAEDAERGKDARNLIDAIHELMTQGMRVSKLEINEHNHVLNRVGGKLIFIAALKKGLEFPR